MDRARAAVVIVSDALVDVVEDCGGMRTEYPGGAGLNLAIGVRRLGVPAWLAAPLADDENGRWLRAVLDGEGVQLIPLHTELSTGVAVSTRVGGEPSYEFSESVYQRRFRYSATDVELMGQGNVIVVNSFPLGDLDQVADLVDMMQGTGSAIVVDPNVRPSLIGEGNDYREGFLRVASVADLVKLSLQDVESLFESAAKDVVANLLTMGVGAVVLTEAEQGASVFTVDGGRVRVPVPARPDPVVDTMGAGDATLAQLLCGIARHGLLRTSEEWRDLLSQAMEVAANTCRIKGAILEVRQETK